MSTYVQADIANTVLLLECKCGSGWTIKPGADETELPNARCPGCRTEPDAGSIRQLVIAYNSLAKHHVDGGGKPVPRAKLLITVI
jgi:hypothetical protein